MLCNPAELAAGAVESCGTRSEEDGDELARRLAGRAPRARVAADDRDDIARYLNAERLVEAWLAVRFHLPQRAAESWEREIEAGSPPPPASPARGEGWP